MLFGNSCRWIACGIFAFSLLALAHSSQAESIRFLVGEIGEPNHHDAYVLPLSDPAAIAHARELISAGPGAGAPIVVARIAKGANGVNRNSLAPGSPPWSWHVTEFESFVDNTIEILDGWPTYVEQDVDGWIQNTNGYIGFWQYTVVAELPPGDYDADFEVDEDDFQIWRAGFGGASDLSADGSGNGVVDLADYVLWRKNLGASVTPRRQPTTTASVPEPASLHSVLVAATIMQLAGTSRRLTLRAYPKTARDRFWDRLVTQAVE
jgi:hypothetical protein